MVAAISLIRKFGRRVNDRRKSFPWLIAAVGVAGQLQDSWPMTLLWPRINLHAVFGILLLCMVLVEMQRAGLADAMPSSAGKRALRRQLSRAVYLQLYLVFGMSQLVHVAALLWNSLGVLHPAMVPPPENLRDYLAYGIFALLTIHVLALLPPQSLKRAVVR
jgi:cytochrome b561